VNSGEDLDPHFVFKMLRRVMYFDLAAFAVSEVKCNKAHAFDRNMAVH
jgi:DNA-directed RNA polymerase alpha subunit